MYDSLGDLIEHTYIWASEGKAVQGKLKVL